MQVITRHVNEELVIGDDIRVTVLDIHRDHVRIAISSSQGQPSYWEETLYWQPESQPRELQPQ